MKPDEFFGSVADDVKPLDLETTCTSPGCNNPRAHGYLMCWDCRDRLELKTEGTRPPKEAPVTPPREQHPWNAKDVHRLRMNAHLGAKRAAGALKRTESSVRNMANLAKPKISLKQRSPQKNEYLQAQIAHETAARAGTVETTGKPTVETTGTDAPTTGMVFEHTASTVTSTDIAQRRATGRSLSEAEDEHNLIADRIARYTQPRTPETTLKDLVKQGMAVRLVPREKAQSLMIETIDIRLRLICATIETAGSGVAPSFRCSIQDNVERIRELVKELAS